jgi:hypothetical protein
VSEEIFAAELSILSEEGDQAGSVAQPGLQPGLNLRAQIQAEPPQQVDRSPLTPLPFPVTF